MFKVRNDEVALLALRATRRRAQRQATELLAGLKTQPCFKVTAARLNRPFYKHALKNEL